MNIILKPDAVNFSGNLKRFKISTTSSISFILKQGSRTLFEASYTPGSNQMVEIDVKDIIEADLNVQFRNLSYPYEQPDMAKTYTAYVDEQSVEFTVVKGGVDNLATADVNFMQFNWLTWQPQIKKVTYYLPEMLTFFSAVESVVKVKAYFKEDNGSYSEETKQLLSIIAWKAYTIPVQYAVIAGEFDSRMPAFYDVWFENTEGVRLSYIQRYVASGTMSEDEQWIIFENSLGGFDTFRAYGTNTLSANHEHQLAEMDEETNEYRVDTSREYTKNTGYLSGYERKWMLDFFPSKQKYLYDGNSLRKIIVTEDSTSYVSNQLPTSYEFTYKYADAKPYLNLKRPEELPTDLDIQVPELGSFTIPPRLVEFPSQNLTEGVLFPVQNPYSESWATTTIGAILNYVLKNIIELGQDGSGGIGHTHPNLELLNALEWLEGYLIAYGQKIKAGYADVADDVTDNVKKLFLSKVKEDQTEFLLKLLGGIISPFLQSQNFITGMLGSGMSFACDDNGESVGWIDKMYIRKKAVFQILEILKTELGGASFLFNASGARATITNVEKLDQEAYFIDGEKGYFLNGDEIYFPDVYRCYFSTDDGDTAIENLFKVGDFVRSQTFDIKSGVYEGISNHYWWRKVVGTGDNYIDLSSVHYASDSDIPAKGDVIVQLGNDKDPDRQSAIVLSAYGDGSPYLTFYQNIDSYSLEGKEIFTVYYDSVAKECVFRVGREGEKGYLRYSSSKGLIVEGSIEVLGGNGMSNFDDALDFSEQVNDRMSQYLGYDGWESLVSEALAGRTIIKGGAINTSLINVDSLFAGDIYAGNATISEGRFKKINVEEASITNSTLTEVNVTGTINAKSGNIGGFKIEDSRLSYNYSDNDKTSPAIIINVGAYESFRINENPTSNGPFMQVRSQKRQAINIFTGGGYQDDPSAIYVVCNGSGYGKAIESYGNVKMTARSGENVNINGLALNVKTISSSTTLTSGDDIIISTTDSNITLNLPRSGHTGKIIWIRKSGLGNITISGNGLQIKGSNEFGDGGWHDSVQITNGQLWMFFCTGGLWFANCLT